MSLFDLLFRKNRQNMRNLGISIPKNFILHDHESILKRLDELLNSRAIINACTSDGASYQTLILEIDRKNKRLIVDCAADTKMNNLLLKAEFVHFFGEFQGVKFSFFIQNMAECTFENEAAFLLQLPKQLDWMQRRQTYRINIPLAHTGTLCQIQPSEMGVISPNYLNLHLVDLSVKGFLMINKGQQFLKAFKLGNSLHGLLYLHNGQHGAIKFTVQYIKENTLRSKEIVQHIGCHFVGLDPYLERWIQFYVQSIQVQRRRTCK